MSEASSVEFEHCKELAMPRGSLFEASSRFLDVDSSNQLMALYALRQSISSIPVSAVDETVKWAKLKWWSEELTADPSAAARHPVVRALHHSGARQRLDDQSLVRLVSDAIMQIDVYPDADRLALFERLAALGETDILLELALDDAVLDNELLRSMSLATGLYAYVSMLLYDHQKKVDLLPLDILAEFQITSSDLRGQPPSTELVAIITQLASKGASIFQSGFITASKQSLRDLPRHLKLRWHLESRRLNRVAHNASRHFGQRSAYGPSDVWFAWRFFRRN